MFTKTDEFLIKLNDNIKYFIILSTSSISIFCGAFFNLNYFYSVPNSITTILFISNLLIILTIITFLNIKYNFSKKIFSLTNTISISFIILAIFIIYLIEVIHIFPNSKQVISSLLNIFIWNSIAFNSAIIFLKRRTFLEKSEQDRTYVSKTSLTTIAIFTLLTANTLTQDIKISFSIALFLPILILLNELQNISQSKSGKSHLSLILFVSYICASFQLGLFLNINLIYSNFISESLLFICLITLSLRNYSYLSCEFKDIQKMSINLARKMGELSMMHIEAQKAQLAKENFLATMSHEIRTPVNGIIGHAELLSDSDISDEQQRLLGMITISSKNLMKLIDEVLDLPNLISGNIILSKEEIDISNLVESVIDVVSPKSFEKGLDLTYFIEPSVPQFIIGDQKRIGQILLNFSNNALKFTDSGEVFIGVTLIDNLNENEIELLFEVKDTGVGIPASKIKKLFKAYSQTDASISRKYGGTGLGLAISAQLIELMGGKIWAESIVGKGTRFLFTLKCKIGKSTPKSTVNIEHLKNVKCLAISENPTMRYILTRRFRQWKMIAKIVRTFEEAQHLSGIEEFQVLIVDIVNDSKKASMFLKGNQINPTGKIPSIALINLGKYSAPNLHLISNETITKPLKTDFLAKTMKKILDHKTQIKLEDNINIISDLQHHVTNKNNLIQSKNPLNILVAEDNPVNQKLIMSILKKMGHNAKLVENGKLAVEEESNANYDLILMDLQMPIMDGLDATRNIIINKKGKIRPKILALTANAMPGDKERCLDAGMDDYLTKPIQIKTLNEKIEQWVQKEKLPIIETESPKIQDVNETNKKDLRILVAEDNLVNQKLIMSILKKIGYNATLVENGALAVEAALKDKYDIIIMDLQMPIMDGLEASKQIKSNDTIQPKPKIIALTANAMAGDKERCLNAGMDDYMTKPLQIKNLDETLKKWGNKNTA
ncbi:response regulator [Fluviispira multicolorata]|uniref:histidine kinase n=1 Tax=Fluviispira multicolorata TaxID=2654512 RepID=A0A833N1W1_9BACT|nr:response regulator [Fluviispira multicolorata]KAB8031792.1 response regulator [Fluviispira multicolorata]